MADYDRRNDDRRNGYRGGNNNRKRRFREDDEYDHRPQRRRYEEPGHIKLRKQLLGIAESAIKRTEDEISSIVKTVADGYEDEDLRNTYLDLACQLIVEQPFKIPFVAATVLAINPQKPAITHEILSRTSKATEKSLQNGAWREVKLLLRFLACIQGLLREEGVFPILEDLFARAVDLQTASSEDGLGLELVKIIQLTIAYLMASSATGSEEHALALLERTDIIASTPHALEALVDPYPGTDEANVHEPQSIISLLQRQLQAESTQGWSLTCIPRPWKGLELSQPLEDAPKHTLPDVTVPSPVSSGGQSRLPEIYFSAYSEQDIETVPSTEDIAAVIIRDALVDTINILDFNRNATAKFLVEMDCFFTPGTFVKRATPFDKLREVAGERSTWKPEDVAVDAVFSQLFTLPEPEHKVVYYHSVLTEACKIAPAAIAPSLGRAIRYLYKNLDSMDLELEYRFMDWFSHHLSNFGFTWKWTEWVDDVSLPQEHPKKAFMMGALEKEVRLSFGQRIRGTLPEPYQPLLPDALDKDTPDFKYTSDETPYAVQARALLDLIRKRAPDPDLDSALTEIQDLAISHDIPDPLVPPTDALVTCLCLVGAKSLSHMLNVIERYKERLLSLGSRSEKAMKQIIGSVMEFWALRPGVGVAIVDKLTNYGALSPAAVLQWALIDTLNAGESLTQAWIYELISNTLRKVCSRVRQLVLTRRDAPVDLREMVNEALDKERVEMKRLFGILEDSVYAVAGGSADAMVESEDSERVGLLKEWGKRWLTVFRRKGAVVESWVTEMMALNAEEEEKAEREADNRHGNGNGAADVAVTVEGEVL